MPTRDLDTKQIVVTREYVGDAATEIFRAEFRDADALLQEDLDSEETARIAADTANTTAIAAESTTRGAAVTNLQEQIDEADAAIFAEVAERKSVIDSNPDDSKRGIELTRDGFVVAQILEGLFNVARLPLIRDAAGVS